MNREKQVFDKINTADFESVVSSLSLSIGDSTKKALVTMNSELLEYLDSNDEIFEFLNRESTTVVADGISLVLLGKLLGYSDVVKCPGVDIVEKLLDFLNDRGMKLATIGCSTDVINSFSEIISNKYPNINYESKVNGYSNSILQESIEMANKEPDLILVALGVPKQEKLINEIFDYYQKGLFIGCGGSIDVLSGTKKRAPEIYQKIGLEWLYRACKEPFRFKRYFVGGISLLKIILRNR